VHAQKLKMMEKQINKLIKEYKDRIKSGKHCYNYLSEDVFYKRIIRDLRRAKRGVNHIKFKTLSDEECQADYEVLKQNKITKTYIIKENNSGLYKIGKSTTPKHRERTLQSQIPNIDIIKIWDKDIEKELHHKYRNHRVRGEWFDLTNIQIRYICTHN
jgi:hypothetical protein